MVRRRLPALGLAFLAAMFGVLMLANAPPAMAKPAESSERSLQTDLEDLLSALKHESARASVRLRAYANTLRERLGSQQEDLGTVGKDAAAQLEDWKEFAAKSWAELHRAALQALDAFTTWMQKQSQPNEPPIPV
jgi:hypothetical protein